MGPGHFLWMELNTGDVLAAKDFFEKTIGWTFENMPVPEGDYWIAKANGHSIAGIVDLKAFSPPGAPPHWFSYLWVDDVDERVKRAKEAGASIKRPPFDIPNVGRIAIIQDPTGAVMGWMTPVARD